MRIFFSLYTKDGGNGSEWGKEPLDYTYFENKY